jgi:uncharacterized protein (DUF4415 family)
MRKLTKEQKRDIRAIAAKKDHGIDFSDAPAVLDWSGAEIGKFYRPAKKPVTIRLDSDVIAWLKADGRGYQTKANWLLRHAMLHFTKGKGLSKLERVPRRRKTGRRAAWPRPLSNNPFALSARRGPHFTSSTEGRLGSSPCPLHLAEVIFSRHL